jgi:hypothetical protein
MNSILLRFSYGRRDESITQFGASIFGYWHGRNLQLLKLSNGKTTINSNIRTIDHAAGILLHKSERET